VTPEELARKDIDRQLAQSGWQVQSRNELNLSVATGIAVREFPMLTGEAATAVYSGLLRMSDFLAMQPNLDIKLHLVGPDDRYEEFVREVARPTFAPRPKPLHSICGFVPYCRLCQRLDEARNVIRFLKPEFINEIAQFSDPSQEVM
jgi:hypothetical protein